MLLLRLSRQFGVFLATLFVSAIAVFGLMAVLPGDPARVALGLNATDEAVAALRAEYGLDDPLPLRFLGWLHDIVTLDLGTSYITNASISEQIAERTPVTFILAGTAMLIAIIVAVPVGTIMAVRHRHASGVVLSAASQVVVAIPAFLAGILLIAVFSVSLGWLPSGGWTPPQEDFGAFSRQLILPALSLGIVQGAILARYVRSAILDVQRQDYIRTARAKGLRPSQALRWHGFRNAAIPVVTVLALQLAYLLIGAVVAERVFVIPGLGSLLIDSVAIRDLIVVQDLVMLLVATVLIINLLVDTVYAVIDPRLRATT